MANMSYCRFENTATDLKDCINALCEGEANAADLSEYELAARDQMYEMCQTYIGEYEAVTEAEEDDNE